MDTGAVLDALVKDTGKADDAERDDIVQQDDGKHFPEVAAVHDVLHAEEHLQHAVDQGGADAPLRAVAVADQDEREHAAHGDAAAKGPRAGELEQTENGADGDEHGALHKAAQAQTARGNDIEDSSKTKIPRCKPFLESSAEDLFPYDGMIRVRFAGQGVTSPNLSRKHPTPRRRICFAVNSVYPKRNHLSSMEKHAIIASELRIFSGMEANHV